MRAWMGIVLAAVLAFCAPAAAYAADIAGDVQATCSGGGTTWEAGSTADLSLLGVTPVGVACSPDVIQVGISCGMEGMCGLDPCLCGAVDEYGCCACNGLEERSPKVVVTSTNPLAALPVQVGGTWCVISLLPGQADLSVSASLIHYNDFTETYHVAAPPVSIVGLLVLVVVVALVVVAVRKARASSSRSGVSDCEQGDGDE